METNTIQIRHVIMSRRLMYYWNILQMDESELVRKVYNVQQLSSCKNDWVLQIREDLAACNIRKSESEIKQMKKYSFKKLVSGCIKEISLNNLIEMKNEHSKSKNIWPSNEMKAYLTTNELSTAEKQFLFSMRCRMNETKNNFKIKYKNKINCSLCSGNYEETEIHLMQCEGITCEQELKTKILGVKYSDIFASVEKQIKAVKLWTKINKKR